MSDPLSRPQSRLARAAYPACAAGLVLLTAACGDDERARHELLSWRAPVEAGQWVRLRNTSGAVRVRRADGPAAEVRVVSRTRPRKSDLRVVIDSADGSYVICAVLSRRARCDEEGYRMGSRSLWNRVRFMGGTGGRAQAEFTVLLPPGVNIDASSVNGGITIEDATGAVVAKTVNGSIKADAGSATSFSAKTVNGSIAVNVDSLVGDGDLVLQTVNGSITAELPAALNADVHMETVNGRIASDFPLTVNGKLNPRRLDAKVGEGGRRLSVKTVNGSVRLAKGE